MSADTIILIRTAAYDERLGQKALQLEQVTGNRVCFAIDETLSIAEMPEKFLKVSINTDALVDLGLLCPDGFNWRCGDYPFYLARQRFPRVRSFWQLEPDVRINFADEGAFFRRYEAYPEIHLLAAYLTDAGPQWGWRRTMEPFAPRVRRCFFPVVRLSATAIDHLLSRRQELTTQFGEKYPSGLWPNDEAFVATELADDDWRCADLNLTGPVYDSDCFDYYRAFSDGFFSSTDDRLYHSVCHGANFLNRLNLCLHALAASWTSPGEKQRILKMLRRPSLPAEIANETSKSEAEKFIAALGFMSMGQSGLGEVG